MPVLLGQAGSLICVLILLFNPSVFGQSMPREDVIDVPAMSDGLTVSNLFQSHMVLQRDKPIELWGWADEGSEVEVLFAGNQVTATSGVDRRWEVELPPMATNRIGQPIRIVSGQEQIELVDVLIGDVWILGGQSNMEFELAKVENGSLEIVSAHYPNIRILTIPQSQGPVNQLSFPRLHQWSDWSNRHFRKGDWDVCSPEIAKELSAIGFVFARRVHQASQIPIGVIDVSRGGTTVETWTPLRVLKQIEDPICVQKIKDFEESALQWDAEADLVKRQEQHQAKIKRMVMMTLMPPNEMVQ